jgi:class 3 adenylate cyclase
VTRAGLWGACIALPAAGFALLLAAPRLDLRWQDNPAHFWLVVGAGALSLGLALVLGEAAARRGDVRVLLVCLALLVSGGFLGLHALATPGMILHHPNAAFTVASPIGLALGSLFAAASAIELRGGSWRSLVRRRRFLVGAVFVLLAVWAASTLTGAILDEPIDPGDERTVLLAIAIPGLVLYALAAIGYVRVYVRRPALLLAAIVTAFALLAEAMIAVAFSRTWHATWWEWHLLLLAALVVVALAVRAEWSAGGRAEALADVYLDETRAAVRDVSVLFADLQGFTSFTERSEPEEVFRMLNAYFTVTLPVVAHRCGGTVDKLIGDAIMVTFNTRGDQEDHAARAARCALDLQAAAAEIARERPGWPRFRAGVNTGEAVVGLVGTRGHRDYTVVGDAVNLAARLEGHADPGGVVIGERTRQALGERARTEELGTLEVRGRRQPVRAYTLLDLDE